MTDAFPTCLPLVLIEEGGYINDALDPGGVTNLGVTQSSWQSWVGHPVANADMHALTPAMVTPFYRTRYWQALSCDGLPGALALCVFDFGVNGGDMRGAMTLQRLVGAFDDGHIGQKTLDAATAFIAKVGLLAAIHQYQAARAAFYHQCAGFDHFGNGWLNRVDFITAHAQGMA